MGIPKFSPPFGEIPWEYSWILMVSHMVSIESPPDIFISGMGATGRNPTELLN